MKRHSALDPGQIGFTFEPPAPTTGSAGLAGLGRVIAAAVGIALKDDPRTREEIAGAMSGLLCEDVTRWMLDAYASEARENHNISAERFLALIAVTNRHDLLDSVTRRIGAAVLVGEEIMTARIGHIRCRIRDLNEELKRIERMARPIVHKGG